MSRSQEVIGSQTEIIDHMFDRSAEKRRKRNREAPLSRKTMILASDQVPLVAGARRCRKSHDPHTINTKSYIGSDLIERDSRNPK